MDNAFDPGAKQRRVDKQASDRWRNAQTANKGGGAEGHGNSSSSMRAEDRWKAPEESAGPGGARHSSHHRWDDEERRTRGDARVGVHNHHHHHHQQNRQAGEGDAYYDVFGEAPLAGAQAPCVDYFPPNFTQASPGPPRTPPGMRLDTGSL